MHNTDELRLRMLKAILDIVTPMQAVQFLIPAAESHLRFHDWGKKKDARHATPWYWWELINLCISQTCMLKSKANKLASLKEVSLKLLFCFKDTSLEKGTNKWWLHVFGLRKRKEKSNKV